MELDFSARTWGLRRQRRNAFQVLKEIIYRILCPATLLIKGGKPSLSDMRGHGPQGQLREALMAGMAGGADGWQHHGPRLEQDGLWEPRLPGKLWPMGGRGWKDSYSSFSEHEVEKLEQRAEKKAEAIFPRKTKVIQERKLIIVHYVPYLRTVFT